jgi:ankyrin repeat protein
VLERIKDGRTDLVFELLSQGQMASSVTIEGISLIRWCAYFGDVSAVRFLLGRGETPASLGENLGLNEAAFHGHWRLCEFLIEQGADVDYPLATTGETPLHAATCRPNRPSHDLVVGLLLACGANPHCTTIVGVETGAFMRDARTKGETPLHRAAAFGSESSVQRLLEAGARRDVKDAHGDTPLSWASWHLRPDAILKLLCYDRFTIHPNRRSAFDHGAGWGVMDASLLGTPHLERRRESGRSGDEAGDRSPR